LGKIKKWERKPNIVLLGGVVMVMGSLSEERKKERKKEE
jgi:hypothetical protein